MAGGFLRRLRHDTRGVSAVEFALLAPTIIMIYFGLVEFAQGYMAQKRTTHVASMVADLTAQNASLNTGQITNIFGIGDKIMRPFSDADLSQRVTSVVRSGNTVTVVWSRATGDLTPLPKNSAYTLPSLELLPDAEGLIVSESAFEYTSPVDFVLPEPVTFRHTSYLRPRNTDQVECSNC